MKSLCYSALTWAWAALLAMPAVMAAPESAAAAEKPKAQLNCGDGVRGSGAGSWADGQVDFLSGGDFLGSLAGGGSAIDGSVTKSGKGKGENGMEGTISQQAAPFDFTISPSTVASDSNGVLTHTVTGATAGQAVRIERFADINGNGEIDLGEPLYRSFDLRDGVAWRIGGIRNSNVPGDDDETVNGVIRSEVTVGGTDSILNRQPGKYVVRATSGGQSVKRAFEITAPNLAQRFSGQVRSAANNAPIPFAMVVALVGEGSPAGSVRADANGNYTFAAPAGGYALLPVADGFTGSPEGANLPAGQTVTLNLLVQPAPVRVSGRVTDAGHGNPVAAIFVLAQNSEDEEGDVAGGLTDADGNYSMGLTAGMWEVRPLSEMAAQAGFVVPEQGPIITAVASPQTVNFVLSRVMALIYGRVTTSANAPVGDLRIGAQSQSGERLEGEGRTSGAGNYTIGVRGGQWEIRTEDAALRGLREASQFVSVTDGSAVEVNVTLGAVTAFVRGRVVDSAGVGIGGLGFHGHFENGGNGIWGNPTGSDGSFEIPVWGGQWYFHIGDDASSRGLLDHQKHLTVVDGQDQFFIFTAPRANREITGRVSAAGGQNLAGIGVYGSAQINGTTYNSSGTTDGSGNYRLPVADGNWSVSLSCQDLEDGGYDCASSKNVAVNNGNGVADFTVSAGMRATGVARSDSGTPFGGMQLFANKEGNSETRNITTNPDGSFSFSISPGHWHLVLSGTPPTGFIAPILEFEATDGTDVTGLQFVLVAANRTASGTVKNNVNQGLANLRVTAERLIGGVRYESFDETDGNGFYQLALPNGTWDVGLPCATLEERGYACPDIQLAEINNNDVTLNFSVQRGTFLRGVAKRGDGTAFAGLQLVAFVSGGDGRLGETGPDGSFAIAVSPGHWHLQTAGSAPNGYLSPNLEFDVTEGVDVSNIQFTLLVADGTVSGFVQTTGGTPVGGVTVAPSAQIGGIWYFAPTAVSQGNGFFSVQVSRSFWHLNTFCFELEARGFQCPSLPLVDASSGSATANITLTAALGAQLEAPQLRSATLFEFTVRAGPGNYEVLGSPTVDAPIGTWTGLGVAQISSGQQTGLAQVNPGANRFFRVRRI